MAKKYSLSDQNSSSCGSDHFFQFVWLCSLPGKSGRTPKSKQRTNLFHERGKALRDDGTPQRIQDITVTKRTYARWKPLCMSTKIYTKQVLENLIL